ncbi:MAG: hypothetical protein EOP05_22605 [Proteobacteria bacterium]|nr:MAG: hypothetical protein EOP05_22605 [Pseudomonadota bacterium]
MFRRLITLSSATLLAVLLSAPSAFAFGPLCERYMNNALEVAAIQTVSRNMQYTPETLCSLERILDVQIVHTNLLDENQRPIPHTWLTLHYNEYSCQYYVRDADKVVTKKNCYNTF